MTKLEYNLIYFLLLCSSNLIIFLLLIQFPWGFPFILTLLRPFAAWYFHLNFCYLVPKEHWSVTITFTLSASHEQIQPENYLYIFLHKQFSSKLLEQWKLLPQAHLFCTSLLLYPWCSFVSKQSLYHHIALFIRSFFSLIINKLICSKS